MKTVSYTATAIKAMKSIPAKDRDAIIAKIDAFAAGLPQDVRNLQGSDLFRLRHGKWRAVFAQEDDTIIVRDVKKRGEAYR